MAANTTALMNKIARKAAQLGLTVVSNSGTSVVIDNASNDLTISYVDASIDAPMGGVANTSAPYLGIGVANPGKIKMKSASTAADTIADVMDSLVAAKVLHLLGGFANNIVLENSDATFTAELRGDVDNLGLGQ